MTRNLTGGSIPLRTLRRDASVQWACILQLNNFVLFTFAPAEGASATAAACTAFVEKSKKSILWWFQCPCESSEQLPPVLHHAIHAVISGDSQEGSDIVRENQDNKPNSLHLTGYPPTGTEKTVI